MSRRPTPGADRAAQNAQTIKALLKLEGNKVCADCKRNKHPRWTSWNIGVFLCIRCSGIHRGLGTDVSRVKSVDLDAWNDDQLQYVLKWGNSRANKYWEAKLAPGHVPSEAKIENFIRTKYVSKRWAMDGPMPDPATLDADGDDDVPLTLVQEKAKIEKSASQRNLSPAQAATISQSRAAAASIDLFGDELTPPARPNTADTPSAKAPQAASTPAARAGKPGESLFGIDFFGGPPPANPGRPSSAASNPTSSGATKRSDLKSSILSLYASAPKQQAQPQDTHNRQPSLGASGSTKPSEKDAFGGLSDAFSSLSFPKTSSAQPRQPSTSSAFSAFSDLTSPTPSKSTSVAPQVTSPPPLSGGNFFNMVSPKPAEAKPAPAARPASNGLDFTFAQAPPALPKPKNAPSQDLFASDDFADFSDPSPAPPPVPPPTKVSSPIPNTTTNFNSAFNLSSIPAPSTVTTSVSTSKPVVTSQPNASVMDPWSSGLDNNIWGAPDPEPSKPRQAPQPSVSLGNVPSRITPNDISGGWGSPISSANKPSQPPAVTADEDFGGWTSASPTQPSAAGPPKPSGGFAGPSDPFDNPWG